MSYLSKLNSGTVKRIFAGIAAIVILSVHANAQTSTERINIKGGNMAWENFQKELYLYPNFETGIVEYKNGKRSQGKLNYNKALGTIQFIGDKGDTLALLNEETIANVTIGKDEFFYLETEKQPQFVQKIADGGKVKLLKNERIRIADTQKIGAMGISNTTGTIESMNRYDMKVRYNELDINENLLLSKTTSFYLETASRTLVPASKKNVFTLFPRHENAIKEYIKSKQITFDNADDLTALTQYLSQL